MKYKLLKDLPLAKAGTEVFIYSPITSWLINIRINEGDWYFNISCLKKEDIPEWLEEVKEPKNIYDLKKGDTYYCIRCDWITKEELVWYFSENAKLNSFITEREAKRNMLLRELATRPDKWLPKEWEEYVNHEDDIYNWDDSKSEIIWYYQWFIFRDKLEYNKYMTEEAKDLLFKL